MVGYLGDPKPLVYLENAGRRHAYRGAEAEPMKADEARRAAKHVRERDERQQAKEAAAKLVQQERAAQEKAVLIIPQLARSIEEAVDKGYMQVVESYADDEETAWALRIVEEHFREQGYKVERGRDSREMGDTEAPCRDYYSFIQVSWA